MASHGGAALKLSLLLLLHTALMVRGESVANITHCPEKCICSEGAVSELVVQCAGFENFEMRSPLPRLSSETESFVTRLDIVDSKIPILVDEFLSKDRSFSKSLRSLSISNAGITEINTKAFKSAKKLEEIELEFNELTSIPIEVFSTSNCPHLRLLSLSHNKNLNIPGHGHFLKSNSLEELDVSYCGITRIHIHSLSKLPNITYMNLANNDIELIHPEALSKLNNLQEIDLSDNNIINIPPKLPPSLQKLNLRNNPQFNVDSLIDLPPNTPINDLDLSQCNIKILPRDIFSKLHDLVNLNISHNSISNLYFPFVLRQLMYLDLSNNELNGPIDSNFLSSCSKLETLKLRWNLGLQLPESGFKGDLSSVYLLDISGCGIETLPPATIDNFTSLTYLNLSNNALQSVSVNLFSSFPDLNTLDLSENNLISLPNHTFKENHKLKYLSLANNPELSPILNNNLLENNSELKTLDISICDLNDVPEFLPTKIETLLLYGNMIDNPTRLTKLIEKSLLSLRTISIEDNPWRCNFEFKQLLALLRDRQIIFDGSVNGTSWSEYQIFVCELERIAEEIVLPVVLRSHFWSLITFSFTLMAFVVVAGGLTVVYKLRMKRRFSRNYRQLSESPRNSSQTSTPTVPNKIYKGPPELSEKPTTFTTSLLFPRFPVTQSEIPASYVSGNYHHEELVP